jgi:hypothetical protein
MGNAPFAKSAGTSTCLSAFSPQASSKKSQLTNELVLIRERSESSSGYTYSAKTSTSTLRTHLDRLHRKEYIRLCDEKGWKNQLKSSRTEGESRAAAGSQSQPPRAPFTQERFLDFLVKFIVATNQVSTLLAWSLLPS